MTRLQHEIGSHRIEIDGDLIITRWFGVCSLQELERFIAILEPILKRVRYPFLFVDNTHAAPGLPEVRRRLFEFSRKHTIEGGVIVYGATAATRVVGMLILRGIALFKGDSLGRRMVILPDEAAAYEWLAKRRSELAPEGAQPPAS